MATNLTVPKVGFLARIHMSVPGQEKLNMNRYLIVARYKVGDAPSFSVSRIFDHYRPAFEQYEAFRASPGHYDIALYRETMKGNWKVIDARSPKEMERLQAK